jgi:RND superfamily putative drug exporter
MNVFFNGLGRFTVRFRWFIVVVWIIGTAASVHFLPSLGSQVNNNNSAFLPASAPSTLAGNLAEPLVGKASLVPVIIIGVSQHGPISAADTQALTRLGVAAKKVPNVEAVQYVGTSQDGRAVQLLVEASIAGYSPGPSADVINGLTAAFTKVGAPPGIQFHLAGAVATNVAQQKQSSTTGNKTQLLSILFIIVLLLFVFR